MQFEARGSDSIKIHINEDAGCDETEIVIHCKQADAEIFRMLAIMRSFDKKLIGTKDGKTFVIDAADVLYFDTADKRTFLYTQNDVLETPLRLYELEEQLAGGSFFRASKSTIINISKIASLRPELSGRIEVTLSNAEKLYVSRQYVPELKNKLGL